MHTFSAAIQQPLKRSLISSVEKVMERGHAEI